MYSSTAIRLFLLLGLLTLVGFGIAVWNVNDRPFGVLLGTLAAFGAALAVIVEVERDDQAQPAEPWQVTR